MSARFSGLPTQVTGPFVELRCLYITLGHEQVANNLRADKPAVSVTVVAVLHLPRQIEITGDGSHDAAILRAARWPAE